MSGVEPKRPYRVLARSYRPTRLSELVGQDALVQTLGNALDSGRIAHAFLLAGIRGVGKTTTARIIARALNCTGPDGTGGPTPEPCGVCPACMAMNEERAVDVIEMDAATRTGIDDIREIVDNVRYLPAAARFKVYIIDEVHMLSEKAFNGLLKTLEEPPPHAKFVFATTEARKVPVTVLSRCQRFDLRRVEGAALTKHLARLCGEEGVPAEDDALQLIVQAAEGSVRDSLSLLDQAITRGQGKVLAATIKDMLGLGDRSALIELLAAVLAGEPAPVLERFGALWALGIDPVALLTDLLALVHGLSRIKAGMPQGETGLVLSGEHLARATELATGVSQARLARLWQMLLKGSEEVRAAPMTAAAAEMILLRLSLVSELPPPGELARMLRSGAPVPEGRPAAPAQAPAAGPRAVAQAPATVHSGGGQAVRVIAAPIAEPKAEEAPPLPQPTSFAELVAALRSHGHAPLAGMLHGGARVLRFEPGRVEISLGPAMPGDIPGRLAEAAKAVTGQRWVVVVGRGEGQPTLAEQAQARRELRLRELQDEPSIRRVLDAFPGAQIVDVKPAAQMNEEREQT